MATGWQVYPLVEWQRLDDVTYNGMPVYRHPGNGDLGYEEGTCLLTLPKHVEAAIKSGVKGRLQ